MGLCEGQLAVALTHALANIYKSVKNYMLHKNHVFYSKLYLNVVVAVVSLFLVVAVALGRSFAGITVRSLAALVIKDYCRFHVAIGSAFFFGGKLTAFYKLLISLCENFSPSNAPTFFT